MKVHNLMEDFVKARVDDLYDQLKAAKTRWLTCDCENCRIDTLSYVLNRVPPKYIVSGRGITHAASDLNTTQIKADVDTLTMDGIRLVSSSKRPCHNQSYVSDAEKMQGTGPYFYFPIFTGTVFDGTNFEPLQNVKITLKVNGTIASMMDQTWQNPCQTFKATSGAYSFCVSPETAQSEGLNKTYVCELNLECTGYESTTYAFSVPVVSEILKASKVTPTYSLKIQDIFLFPEGLENPME